MQIAEKDNLRLRLEQARFTPCFPRYSNSRRMLSSIWRPSERSRRYF